MNSAEWLQLENGQFPVDKVAAEVIPLRHKFPLFTPKRTALGYIESDGLPYYVSRILLDTETSPPFPVNIDARPVMIRSFAGREEVLTRRQVITPFHPEMGYPVSIEDMDPEMRREKVGRLRMEALKKQDDYDFHQTDPLMVFLSSSRGLGGLELIQHLASLRLLLHFPESLYVGKAMDLGSVMENLYFHEFVPADMPHLQEVSRSIREGFCLFIPTDPNLVQQVKGEFVRLD